MSDWLDVWLGVYVCVYVCVYVNRTGGRSAGRLSAASNYNLVLEEPEFQLGNLSTVAVVNMTVNCASIKTFSFELEETRGTVVVSASVLGVPHNGECVRLCVCLIDVLLSVPLVFACGGWEGVMRLMFWFCGEGRGMVVVCCVVLYRVCCMFVGHPDESLICAGCV